jgi:apolipoprotein N-acyltransferase
MSVADSVIIMWGWRRVALALIAGAASALAFPPFDIAPVLFVTIPVFIWLIDGAVAPERAFWLRRLFPAAVTGWLFGFGFFLGGLWWIGAAFLVDADEFAWLMPFAVIALPAGLALFWAFGAMLARLFWSDGWPRILIFAVAMTIAEWLRGTLFGGFPWNTIGYAVMPLNVLMQTSSLVGLWGMTLFAFLLFSAPALVIGVTRRDRVGRYVLLTLIVLLFAADLAFGTIRLHRADDSAVLGVRLRLVQPAIDQSEKWQAGRAAEIFNRLIQLSDFSPAEGESGLTGITHVIWPESAVPFLLTAQPSALAAIADMLPPSAKLITGATRASTTDAADGKPEYFNSIFVIGEDGVIRDAYDKVHLVPFGEYLPFQETLEAWGIRQLTKLPGGFSAGTTRRNLSMPSGPSFAPLICYEAIFPGAVIGSGERPGFLLNVTNDAWYGNTPGPPQHLRYAQLRAVEEGLPLVRTANNGISAIVDSYGRIEARLDLGKSGVVDGVLPVALPPTLYARYGDRIALGLLLIAALAALFGRFTLSSRAN